MALMCINGNRECTGCSACQNERERTYYCPICGEEIFETVFVSDDGEVIGCENCVKTKEPYEVFEDEV